MSLNILSTGSSSSKNLVKAVEEYPGTSLTSKALIIGILDKVSVGLIGSSIILDLIKA